MIILDAWTQSQQAIREFLVLPGLEQVSVGLGLFPLPDATDAEADSCVVADYQTPQVPIAPVEEVYSELVGAMLRTEEGRRDADGARHARGDELRVRPRPGRTRRIFPAIVLVTDGTPSTCEPETVDAVASIAAEGAAGGVRTFVVGFGLGPDLRAIASAGGTEVFDVTLSEVETELLAALDEVRRIGECRYQLPPAPEGRALDPRFVNVQTNAAGTAEVLPQAAGAAACGAAQAWHYDDPAAPGQIVLCPEACQAVRAASAAVEVVVGCETLLI